MQAQAYSTAPDPTSLFSDRRESSRRENPYTKPCWWQVRAQWAVTEMDFSRPSHRPKQHYPTPRVLQHVALVLCMYGDGKNGTGEFWMSINTLKQRLGFSDRREVQRAVHALLEDFGLFELVALEGPNQGRRYRLTVGWPDDESDSSAPNKTNTHDSEEQPEEEPAPERSHQVSIRRAYCEARLERHDTKQIGPMAPRVVSQLIRIINDARRDYEQLSFSDVAGDLMRIYMQERGRDGKLGRAHHPFEWIGWYYAELERGLRRQYRKQHRPAPKPPARDEAPSADEVDRQRAKQLRSLDALPDKLGAMIRKASGLSTVASWTEPGDSGEH